MKTRVAVIGPLNVDYVTSIGLTVDEALLAFPTPYIKAPIAKKAGGKGLIAGRAAVEMGLHATLLSCVGGSQDADPDGAFLIAEAQAIGLTTHIKRVSGYRTAVVLLTYLKDNNPRMMVCDNDVIFQHALTDAEISQSIGDSHILYVSSYSALEVTSRNSLIAAIRFARSRNILTVIDLVPHDLTNHIGRKAVFDLVKDIDVLVLAPITLRHLAHDQSEMNDLGSLALAGFSSLKVRRRLVILDKIAGIICETDGTAITIGPIEKIGKNAPATGRGEQIIFSICTNLLSTES